MREFKPCAFTTAFNRLLRLDGVDVRQVDIGSDPVTVEVALRRKGLVCPRVHDPQPPPGQIGLDLSRTVTSLRSAAPDGEDRAWNPWVGGPAPNQSTGTFEWRVEGWRLLLRDSGPQGLEQVAVGKPFGEGWVRQMSGSLVEVSPHNFYVEAYLRVGTVGLAAFLLLYVMALRGGGMAKEWRPPEPAGSLPKSVLQTLVGVQLLYYLTYSPDIVQAMLLGLGCAAAVRVSREHKATFTLGRRR